MGAQGRSLPTDHGDLDLLGTVCKDWGAWDDTYQFVQDRNEKFIDANFTDETFSDSRLSVLAVLDANRELVWGGCFDLENKQRTEFPGLWPMLTDQTFPLTQFKSQDDAKGCLLPAQAGPLLISCVPILTSKREGPILGSMIMGRLLSQKEITELAGRAGVNLTTWTASDTSLPGAEAKALEELCESGKPVIREADSKTLLAYAKMDDVFGKPAVLLRVNVPRQVTSQE
jgi:sensor domain CHASE-containing protein